jgi:serine/threonine-protein kinase HipA
MARAVRDHVPGEDQVATFRHLATLLLLTYAARNADCHAKNLALLYTKRADVHISPVYDVITTTVYAGYQDNPPGISFTGPEDLDPGQDIVTLHCCFGVPVKVQSEIVEAIGDAVSDAAPLVRAAMKKYQDFGDLGARMLVAWNEGVSSLRDARMYSLPGCQPGAAFEGLAIPDQLETTKTVTGKSEGLVRRGKRKKS